MESDIDKKAQDVAGATSDQRSASEPRLQILEVGAEALKRWANDLQVPAGTGEAVIGTILGCVAVRALTKSLPSLGKPVEAAGYLAAGYAAYRGVKALAAQIPAEKAT
jgi:hypothetical protein